jgi:hypothetical protein
MATTTRRRTTKSPAVRNIQTGQDFEPVRFVTKTAAERGPEERVVLFSLDDQEFTIPRKFPVNLGLKVIRTMRKRGEAIAMAELLEEVIGEDAYEALVNYPDITNDDIARLMQIVNDLALGSLDGPKGRSASA